MRRVAHHPVIAPSDDVLHLYLEDVAAYHLLTREQEADLARRIHKGDRDALGQLVAANLRFVIAVAKRYQNRGMALSDLIAEGNLGLIRAAERFDETRGIKFISYAVWWIRQAITQALCEQSHLFRLPVNQAGAIHQIGRRANALVQELGREPTWSEIAAEMDVSEEDVARALSSLQSGLSLDAPRADGEVGSLLEYLPDEAAVSPEELSAQAMLTSYVDDVLAKLRPREAQVLRLHYGLGTDEPMTLEDIGSRLGITRERVRQIKEKALWRIRRMADHQLTTADL